MMNWLIRWLEAASEALSKAPDALPDDARRELEMWDAETIARYKAEQAAGTRDAPPDAPHIKDGGI